MNDWQLVARDSGRIIVERLELATNFWTRFLGLQFRRGLPPTSGLLLAPCAAIHTMWMRFAIDVAMLDRAGRVLAVRRAIRPWRIVSAPRGTHAVLECAAGHLTLEVDEIVALRPRGERRSLPKALAGFAIVEA